MRAPGGVAAVLVAAALLLAAPARAQTGEDLDRRIRDAAAERVAFRFAVDPEVTVCENGFRRGDEKGYL